MKKWTLALAVMTLISAGAARADSARIEAVGMDIAVSSIIPMNVIDWKVGDSMDFDLDLGGFLKGTMHKEVTKDEGDALWIVQDMDLMIQKQKAEILLNKADGKILKFLVNGKEQQIPDEKIEIISQEQTEITVKAGKFRCIHVQAKTSQGKAEIWANPFETTMDGGLKLIQQAQGMNVTMELTAFKKIP